MKRIFSAPGRIEVCGNHTDHQCGYALAAAIDLEASCTAERNETNTVRIHSRGFGTTEVDLSDLSIHEEEKGTTAALVRGVAAWFHNHGHEIHGYDAEITSNIPAGAGLSSSAAFEVLLGNINKGLFQAAVSPLDIALAGQFAENIYFGKPCGLLDQAASSFGGLTMLDFNNPNEPIVTPVNADLSGYTLGIVVTGGSHADLTPDYAAVTTEMRAVAAHFGKDYLRGVSETAFRTEIKALRALGDRAILRAIHFFAENERVKQQAGALQSNDIKAFLALVNESGRSSISYLQNVYSTSHPEQQGVPLALALAENILAGKGAWRVHGGGFAGTILTFVPDELKEAFQHQMCAVFGEDSCHFLHIRKAGGGEVI